MSKSPGPIHASWSSLSLDQIATEMGMLDQLSYRARQAVRALHRNWVWEWSEVSELPKDLRERMRLKRPLRSLAPEVDLVSRRDGANKVLFRAADGGRIESVLMRGEPSPHARHTVCVSSQIGCPVGCAFCASGLAGLARNLTCAEIVDQVEFFAGRLRKCGKRIDNVVYMGMGEPFLNYQRVMRSMAQLRDAQSLGLGARRFTVSTVGIVPMIRRFGREAGEVNLAVSLHAPDDELRSRLVPINPRFPIDEIVDAVQEYIALTHRRVSFEYVLLRGTNDSPELASSLARLLNPLKPLVHVNLIPWNPFGESGFSRATRHGAETFAGRLRTSGINTTIRYSKGLDINAACGQLRSSAVAQEIAS